MLKLIDTLNEKLKEINEIYFIVFWSVSLMINMIIGLDYAGRHPEIEPIVYSYLLFCFIGVFICFLRDKYNAEKKIVVVDLLKAFVFAYFMMVGCLGIPLYYGLKWIIANCKLLWTKLKINQLLEFELLNNRK